MTEPQPLLSVATSTSPTGVPVIPPKAVPWIAVASAFVAALAETLPEHTVVGRAAAFVMRVSPIIAMLLPGWRTQP